jgi:NAD(P)H-hydrate epimerase
VVITPHLKEFSNLAKEEIPEILKGGFSSPFAFANAHKICVLLKNAVTIITNGQEIFLNVKGTSGQAKGGSGDVLAGVIAGLCASGLSVFEGAQAAAFLVGEAAEIAVKKTGEYSLLASDVVQAFLSVTQDF